MYVTVSHVSNLHTVLFFTNHTLFVFVRDVDVEVPVGDVPSVVALLGQPIEPLQPFSGLLFFIIVGVHNRRPTQLNDDRCEDDHRNVDTASP